MTQLTQARAGTITPEMQEVARKEHLEADFIREQIASGRLVIPANRVHLSPQAPKPLKPCGVGRSVTTKINANLGASSISSCKESELQKLQWAVRYGADAVMDLSTGKDLDEMRSFLIAHSPVPVGTVPIYSMISDRPIEELTADRILRTLETQAAQGVDFFTLHAGILRDHLPLAARRKLGICSRGGSLLAKWMKHHGRENLMYEIFEDMLAIMAQYDVTASLGDGLRPGCLADASDQAQMAELEVLGQLVHRCREAGVQCVVEGPGHVPYDQIEMNMKRQQELCDDAPFYVLGPIVTDVFPGYDHITSSIGATAAAYHGASFLCYVTPSEHLALPDARDVQAGCIAYKIAAHAADVALKRPGARDWDDRMADARKAFDWSRQFELAFDGETARTYRDRDGEDRSQEYCSMCGKEWCAVRLSREALEQEQT
jgi:phosphomethylpyrimidine synthase